MHKEKFRLPNNAKKKGIPSHLFARSIFIMLCSVLPASNMFYKVICSTKRYAL